MTQLDIGIEGVHPFDEHPFKATNHGAAGSLNSSLEYIGRASIPNTGVVAQRYATAVAEESTIIDKEFDEALTLPFGI